MCTTRRTFIAGSIAAVCAPIIPREAFAYFSATTFAYHASISYERTVRPDEINPRVVQYFADPRISKYSGVNKLWNHYHNHWKINGYRNPAHTFKCPCCFLVLFEMSCGQTTLEDDFFRKYRGRNEFNWHYNVQWDRFDPMKNYSLDHYARLGDLNSNGDIVDDTEAGFAYYANNRQRVIDFHGKEAFSFRSSARDTNNVESIPEWLVPC